MNRPAASQPAVPSPDRIGTRAPNVATILFPVELLDACGNGYTAADLARALAAVAGPTPSTEAAAGA
jgi:hypothetical protein